MNKILITILSLMLAITTFSCNKPEAKEGINSSTNTSAPVEVGSAQTPTEAYTMLYKAVKAKQPEAIKKMLTQKTLGFAEMAGSQQKKDINQVVENGFTSTTFAESLPKMRDERVKDNMGALEVWNEKDKRWEDLPFILEDGGWKLAIGDIFGNTYQKPAKGQAQIEDEASNSNKMVEYSNTNPTVNSNIKVQKPMQAPQKPLQPANKP